MRHIVTKLVVFAVTVGGITLSVGCRQTVINTDEQVNGTDVLADGGFETVPTGNRLPRGWLVLPETKERGAFQIVDDVRHGNSRSLRMDPTGAGKDIYAILQIVPTEYVAGKRVTLRSYVRTDALTGGGASAGMALVINGLKLRTVPADTAGQFRELVITQDIPANAQKVVVLLTVRGTHGHVYFDDIELLVPGANVANVMKTEDLKASTFVKTTKRPISQLGKFDPQADILFRSNRWARTPNEFVPCELYTMRNDGLQIERLTYTDGKVEHIDSEVSPDRTMILTRRVMEDTNRDGKLNQLDQGSVWVINLQTKEEWQLSPEGRNALGESWFPDSKRVAMCIDFGTTEDIYTIDVDGTEMKPVIETPDFIEGDTAVSQNGKLIAYNRIDPSTRRSTIWVVGEDGSNPRQVTDGGGARGSIVKHGFPLGDYDPEWSPDGQLIVFGRGLSSQGNFGEGVWNICITSLDRRHFRNLTNTQRVEGLPSFSPDGKRIVFFVFSERDQLNDIMTFRPDGTDERRLTDGFQTHDFFPSYIPGARSGEPADAPSHNPF